MTHWPAKAAMGLRLRANGPAQCQLCLIHGRALGERGVVWLETSATLGVGQCKKCGSQCPCALRWIWRKTK